MRRFKEGLKPPSLIRILKNVLQENPDDGQILKELLQNAEDAGATEVKFLLDHVGFENQQYDLSHRDFAKFQGPALYAYNNAEFTEDDWGGICMVNHSIKERDHTKIGRFGVGFKSVFHMTDFPGLLTGPGIGFIDPSERYFKDERNRPKSCEAWDLKSDSAYIASHRAQFGPFFCSDWKNIFEASDQTLRTGYYVEKTLFRFPLRTTPSELSETIYTTEKVRKLFDDLEKDANVVLLFMKHLQKIEIYERSANGKINKILRIKITDSSIKTAAAHRKQFVEYGAQSSGSVVFPMDIEVSKVGGERITNAISRWYVCLYCGGEILVNDKKMQNVQAKLCVHPSVGVAFDVTEVKNESAKLYECMGVLERSNGRIFCFLPLALEEECPTGLACHVHGTFALDQSRQHVKWPSADQNPGAITDYSILWNMFLRTKLLPVAIATLALRFSEKFSNNYYLVYSLMPNFEKIRPNWKPLAESFYQEIIHKKMELFYAQYARKYCPIVSNSAVDNMETPDNIREFLTIAGVYPFILPNHVLNALENCSNVATALKRVNAGFVIDNFKRIQAKIPISDEMKLNLLAYLLPGESTMNSLNGVELVPLADGSWTEFYPHRQQQGKQLYVLPSENEFQRIFLLPGPNQHFIRPDLPHDIKQCLERKISQGTLYTERLDLSRIIHLLNKIEGLRGSENWIQENRNPCLNNELLHNVWKLLTSCGLSSLQLVENLQLHLIPMNGCQQLAALNRNKPILNISDSIESELQRMFQDLQIETVADIPEFVARHQLVSHQYIFPLTARGVLDAMKRIEEVRGRAELIKTIGCAPDSSKDALRQYFARRVPEISKFSETGKDFLRLLPIFKTVENSGFQPSHFHSAINIKAVHMFPPGIAVPVFLLDLNDTDTRRLADVLNIYAAANMEIIITEVFQGISQYKDEILLKDTMKAILLNFEVLINARDPSFCSWISRVKFIQKNDREYAAAVDLYDDEDPVVTALFEGEDKFPIGEFAGPSYRPLLRQIGLKGSENIQVQDLISLAKDIQKDKNEEKSKRLMEAMEQKIATFNNPVGKSLITDLKKIKWILPRSNRGPKYPESLSFVAELEMPSKIYSDDFVNLVGSVAAVIRIKEKWKQLANVFDWNKKPKIEDVIEHFLNVIEWYAKQSDDGAMNGNQENEGHRLAQSMFEDIYAFLATAMKESEAHAKMISKRLAHKRCVLVDTNLMLPSRCAFESEISQKFLPYLCAIPRTSCLSYGALLKNLGVKDFFQVKDYTDVLADLFNSCRGNALGHDQIKFVLYIINDCLASVELTIKQSRLVYVPDEKKVLRLASEMWYSPESTTVNVVYERLSPESGYPCHEGITKAAAIALGIRSKAKAMLAPFAEPFGQKEKLTARLKKFLEANPYGSETLKELIQNADDAGATKVHFIIDSRHLPDDNVFDDDWKPLQGPAVCIFNDSNFTEADLQGIQDLGEGSKSADLTKIGQYGIGFNGVYHLTDAPTVLTKVGDDRKLCVLDPTYKHTSFASATSPGCMFKNVDVLKQHYPDVFVGYFEEHYGTQSGTVFRLPLRRQPSELSDEIFSTSDLEKTLLSSFKTDIHDYLLFLNNVEEIALKRVNQNTNQLEDLIAVTRERPKDAQRVQNFRALLRKYADEYQKVKINQLPTSATIEYELQISDSRGSKETWLIVQRLGFEQLPQLSEAVRKSYDNFKLNQLPHVGVAYLLETRGESRERKGRIFCFLPLPLFTSLPVHINGHFALDHANRRALLNEEVGGQKKGWNLYLMQHIIAPAYCSLILAAKERMKTLNDISLKQYHSLFPPVKQCDDKTATTVQYENLLSVAVYQRIGSRNMDILPVDVGGAHQAILWFKPIDDGENKTGYFDSLSTQNAAGNDNTSAKRNFWSIGRRSDANQKKSAEELRTILTRCGFNIFASPIELYENFTMANVKVKKISPDTVLEFFSGKKAEMFTTFEKSEAVQSIGKILEYCSESASFREKLLGTPLQVTQDETIRLFDETDRKYVSKHSWVAPHAPHCFVHSTIAKAAKLSPSPDNADKKADDKLCKHFGIQDFANMLPLLLPETEFKGSEKKISAEVLNRHLSTLPQVNNENEKPWVERVWNFLGAEVTRRIRHDKSTNVSETEFARNCLIDINDWCLMPVKSETDGAVFIAVEKARVIMTESIQKHLAADILAVLRKLGFSILQIDTGVRETDSTYLLKLLLDGKGQSCAVFVVAALQERLTQPLPPITAEESTVLINFLSKNFEEFETIPNVRQSLMKLPYFRLFNENYHTALEGFTSYVIPTNIEEVDSAIWIASAQEDSRLQRQSVQFLRYDENSIHLIRNLGCKELSVTGVYCLFIFKYFPIISAHARISHMKFIKENLTDHLSRSEKIRLVDSLKNLRFLWNRVRNELQTASSFVDPRVDIFKLMEEPDSFPPKPYTSSGNQDKDGWLDFLVQYCGLVNEVSEYNLLAYAQKLARLLNAPDDEDKTELETKSEYVVKEILRNIKLSQNILKQIRTVRFICQHRISDEMQEIYPQSFQVVAFDNSYASWCSDWVWSNVCLLPPAATFNKSRNNLSRQEETLLRNLGVKLEPSVNDVVKHLENICSSERSRRGVTIELDRVLKSIFTVLEQQNLPDEWVIRLRRVKCVTTKKRVLVKPNQIVLHTNHEIESYLYKLPIDLGSHFEFLKKLGALESPTLRLYSNIMSDLYKKNRQNSTGFNRHGVSLSDEHQRSANKAMRGFIELLDKLSETEIADSLNDVTELHLFCQDDCIHPASDVVVLDNPRISSDRLKRFQYPLVSSPPRTKSANSQNYFEKLPERFRCRFFSKVVKERIREGFTTVVISPDVSRFVERLQSLIRTQEFANGIERLLRHAEQSTRSAHPQQDRSTRSAALRQKLSTCRIVIADTVVTYLSEIDGSSAIRDSDETCSFFFEKRTIYVSQEFCGLETRDVLFIRIAEVLNSLTGNALDPVLLYVPMILNCNREQVNKRLDDIRIVQNQNDESDYDTADDGESSNSSAPSSDDDDDDGQNVGAYVADDDTFVRGRSGRNVEVLSERRDSETSSDEDLRGLVESIHAVSPNRGIRAVGVAHQEPIFDWFLPSDETDESSGGGGDDDQPDTVTRSYPQTTAQGWLRQARHDLRSASVDENAGSYEWSCYKYHQAAEKAIKSILIHRRCPVTHSHDLEEISDSLPENEIKRSATELQSLLRYDSRMRYPSQNGDIPHDLHSLNISKRAGKMTDAIIQQVTSLLGPQS